MRQTTGTRKSSGEKIVKEIKRVTRKLSTPDLKPTTRRSKNTPLARWQVYPWTRTAQCPHTATKLCGAVVKPCVWLEGSVVLRLNALFETEALAVHLQNVNMVG
jgi:hypothetical protein